MLFFMAEVAGKICKYYIEPKKCGRFVDPNSSYRMPCFESGYKGCAIYYQDVSIYDEVIGRDPEDWELELEEMDEEAAFRAWHYIADVMISSDGIDQYNDELWY